MKKIFFIIPVILIFASCVAFDPNIEKQAKNVVIVEKNLPKEQSVGLFISYGMTVTNYNGTPVNWGYKTAVYLPPGRILLVADITIETLSPDGRYRQRYNGENMPFLWTFNAGERRYLQPHVNIENEPVIFVVNPEDKSPFNEHPAYQFPKGGSTILK